MSKTISESPVQSDESQELDLIDLFAVLLRYKALIIIITMFSIVGVLAFSILSLVLPPDTSPLPNKYTANAQMLINDSSFSGGGIGSLSSIAGISVTDSSTYSKLALFIAQSDTFLDTLVEEFDLISRYGIDKYERAESRRLLQENLSVSFDKGKSVLSISFTDKDPQFTQIVVNFIIRYMEKLFTEAAIDNNQRYIDNLEFTITNIYDEIISLDEESKKFDLTDERGAYAANGSSLFLESTRIKREIQVQEAVYTQLKTQYELIKVTMASENPVFQVEYAQVPDKKSEPSRGMLCIIVSFAGFFLSVFLAFLLNAVKNIKKDPDAMARLRGNKS